MDKAKIKKELAGMTREQLHEQLELAMKAVEEAADILVKESEAAQTDAAVAFVQTYKDEAAELEKLEQELDEEDREDARAEELEKAGKLPE